MKQSPSDKVDQFSPEETARRRDEALLRALNTPPKPHSARKLGKPGVAAAPERQRPVTYFFNRRVKM
jgi:hypothetical protein